MKIELNPMAIPCCHGIDLPAQTDVRGRFVKLFHSETFKQHNLHTDFQEEFWSVSRRHVLRGLHFQVPPHAHVKLVCCLVGEIFDAIVDLRRGSPSYGQSVTMTLSADKPKLLYLPIGIAHGFQVLSESAVVLYKVSSLYAPTHDKGILWNSAGIQWPDGERILSTRDQGFASLAEFESPFVYEGGR